jgi:hypothetical protein
MLTGVGLCHDAVVVGAPSGNSLLPWVPVPASVSCRPPVRLRCLCHRAFRCSATPRRLGCRRWMPGLLPFGQKLARNRFGYQGDYHAIHYLRQQGPYHGPYWRSHLERTRSLLTWPGPAPDLPFQHRRASRLRPPPRPVSRRWPPRRPASRRRTSRRRFPASDFPASDFPATAAAGSRPGR